MKDLRIAETFTLPSKGLIYEEKVDPEIVIGSMKTKHEMLRLSATSNNANRILSSIIDDCLEKDPGISSYDMCLGDFQFLLYKLRIITFGPDYELTNVCPFCHKPETSYLNLDELSVNTFDESLVDKLSLHLPVSDVDVTLTLQTPRIIEKINRLSDEKARRTKKSAKDYNLLYTITTSIERIDDEIPNAFTLEDWVNDLNMNETMILLNRIDEINSMIGVQLNIGEYCSHCNQYYEYPFRITTGFFRPGNI